METWKTGCTPRIDSGSRRVNEWVPGLAMISKGPVYLSEGFLDGSVEEFGFNEDLLSDGKWR